MFCAVLAYSRVRFVCFADNERSETTLSCLAKCFEYLGGVPKTVLADRMGYRPPVDREHVTGLPDSRAASPVVLSAAPRKVPTSLKADSMSIRSLTDFMEVSLGRCCGWQTPPPSPTEGHFWWMLSMKGGRRSRGDFPD